MPPRRFPPPWTIDEMNNACFIVRDKNGQRLGYFYFLAGAQPAHGDQSAREGRGVEDGGQLRQAVGSAGAVAVRASLLVLDDEAFDVLTLGALKCAVVVIWLGGLDPHLLTSLVEKLLTDYCREKGFLRKSPLGRKNIDCGGWRPPQ